MKNYYEVVAKCGHVGRMYYYEGHFYIISNSKKEAAGKVKGFPRVKKDHDDVILGVYEVSESEYKVGLKEMQLNPYFKCTSRHEQNAVRELIQEHIFPETGAQLEYREKCDYYRDRKNGYSKIKGIRNPYKYAKYNRVSEKDDIWA